MAEQQAIAITEADQQSFEGKWQTFVDSLTPAEQALLETRLAGAEGDVQGYSNTEPAFTPKTTGARPRPRPGSSAQPPR